MCDRNETFVRSQESEWITVERKGRRRRRNEVVIIDKYYTDDQGVHHRREETYARAPQVDDREFNSEYVSYDGHVFHHYFTWRKAYVNHEKHREGKNRKKCSNPYRLRRAKRKADKQAPRVQNHFLQSSKLVSTFRDKLTYDFVKKQISDPKMVDVITSKIEDLILLIHDLHCIDKPQMIVSRLIAYVKTFHSGSICSKFYPIIKSVVDNITGADQKSEVNVTNQGTPEWLLCLRQMKDNWKLAIHNAAFKKMSELIVLLVTIGIADPKILEINYRGIRLFSQNSLKIQTDATSVIDAICDISMYFIEGGYRVFEIRKITGAYDFSPLLYDDPSTADFEDDYAFILKAQHYAAAGNLQRMDPPTSEQEYELKLESCLECVERLIKSCAKESIMKTLLSNKHKSLLEIEAEFLQKRAGASVREQPFCFVVYGDSSMGKTTVVNQLGESVLMHLGYPIDARFKQEHQSDNNFQENARSHTIWKNYDDFGNKKCDGADEEFEDFRKQSGNTRVDVNMASLPLKGKVQCRNKLITATTNVAHLNAHKNSNEPVSGMRRFHYHVAVKVREDCANKQGQFDASKIEKMRIDGHPELLDAWEFIVYKAVVVPRPFEEDIAQLTKRRCQDYTLEVVKDNNGVQLRDIGFLDLNFFMCTEAKKHQKRQRQILLDDAKRKETLASGDICEKCNMITPFCVCKTCNCCNKVKCVAESQVDEARIAQLRAAQAQELDEKDRKVKKVDKKKYLKSFKYSHNKKNVKNQSWFGETFEGEAKRLARDVEENSDERTVFTSHFSKAFAYCTDAVYLGFLEGDWLPLEVKHREDTLMELIGLVSNLGYDLSYWIPRRYFNGPRFKQFLAKVHGAELRRKLHKTNNLRDYVTCAVPLLLLCCLCFPNISRSSLYSLLCMACMIPLFVRSYCTLMEQKYLSEIVVRETKKSNISDILGVMRTEHQNYITKAGLLLMGAVSTIAFIKGLRGFYKVVVESQGSFTSTPIDGSVDKRMAYKHKASNFSSDAVMNKLTSKPITGQAYDDTQKVIERNVCRVRIMRTEGDNKVIKAEQNATFIQSNYCFANAHFIRAIEEDDELEFIRKPGDEGSNNIFRCKARVIVKMLGTDDKGLLFVPNSGDFRDLTRYLPDVYSSGNGLCTTFRREKEGNMEFSKGTYKMTQQSWYRDENKDTRYSPGIQTLTMIAPKSGDCGAPVVSMGVHRLIVGFHQSGDLDNPTIGYGVLVTRGDYEALKQQAHSDVTVFPVYEENEIRAEHGGSPTFASFAMDHRSPLIDMQGNFRYYGSTLARSHPKSEVIPSKISDAVTKHMGQENIWGPPKLKGPDGVSPHIPWELSLEKSTNAHSGLGVEELNKAITDYEDWLQKELFTDDVVKEIRKTTDMEALCGVDGKPFWDAVKLNTATGFGFPGKKRKYVTDLDPEEFPDYACPRVVDTAIKELSGYYEQCYLRGKKANPVFKASLKDEPTLKSKEKVRVFQACPMSFTLLVRKYFLSITSIFCDNPQVSECAVGISTDGLDWHNFSKYVTKYGSNQMLALDHKEYDLRMPSQLIMAAFGILIRICRRSGNFSEDDIMVMFGMAYDIANSVTSYNGDMIGHRGSNPSGNPLTVIINSIVNSLILRCAWYSQTNDKFRDGVTPMTYGDDLVASVHKKYSWFNMIFIRDYLAEYGIIVTMAEKGAEFVGFLSFVESDFLKRKSRYIPELGIQVGALNELSIFKSLHNSKVSSDCTQEEIAANAISGALREYFNYGEEVFEFKREQLRKVAHDCGLVAFVPELAMGFDQRVADFKSRHAVALDAAVNHD